MPVLPRHDNSIASDALAGLQMSERGFRRESGTKPSPDEKGR